jgi:hypothetical protein
MLQTRRSGMILDVPGCDRPAGTPARDGADCQDPAAVFMIEESPCAVFPYWPP